RDARAPSRASQRGPRGTVDRRGGDGRRNGVEDAGGHGGRLRRLDAAATCRQQQQAETERSAHAELCTLTRVRVNGEAFTDSSRYPDMHVRAPTVIIRSCTNLSEGQ